MNAHANANLPLATNLVYLDQVVVSFDGFKALDISSLGIERNELRVVIGPNGAGKTTLCDVISGKTAVSSGKVYFDGRDTTELSDIQLASMGIGRKFQTPTVFDSLTVFENMEMALPGHRGVLASLFAKVSSEESDRIMSILRRVRLDAVANRKARLLSHGQRQWLEISMLILASPILLLVDEPAAGLTDFETHLTAELLLELKGSHTVLVIEHDMDFVRQLGSRVTVLNEGKVLAEGSLAEVQANPTVKEAYLGR